MAPSHTSKLESANHRLLVERELDAVEEFFAPDYVSHIMDRDMTGGPAAVRKRDMFTSRFEDGRIAEDWAISGLAEGLLLARKR